MSNIVAGVLDSLSAGILIYTSLVELLAHDFIFNREMAIEVSISFDRSIRHGVYTELCNSLKGVG
jgi:hypothetical protein